MDEQTGQASIHALQVEYLSGGCASEATLSRQTLISEWRPISDAANLNSNTVMMFSQSGAENAKLPRRCSPAALF